MAKPLQITYPQRTIILKLKPILTQPLTDKRKSMKEYYLVCVSQGHFLRIYNEENLVAYFVESANRLGLSYSYKIDTDQSHWIH